jgi:ribosomal protein L28
MRKCARCEKTSQMGGNRILLRGHYNPTNWTRKYPNLQYATIDGKRQLVCTGCLRTLHKAPHKVVRKKAEAAVAAK